VPKKAVEINLKAFARGIEGPIIPSAADQLQDPDAFFQGLDHGFPLFPFRLSKLGATILSLDR